MQKKCPSYTVRVVFEEESKIKFNFNEVKLQSLYLLINKYIKIDIAAGEELVIGGHCVN